MQDLWINPATRQLIHALIYAFVTDARDYEQLDIDPVSSVKQLQHTSSTSIAETFSGLE